MSVQVQEWRRVSKIIHTNKQIRLSILHIFVVIYKVTFKLQNFCVFRSDPKAKIVVFVIPYAGISLFTLSSNAKSILRVFFLLKGFLRTHKKLYGVEFVPKANKCKNPVKLALINSVTDAAKSSTSVMPKFFKMICRIRTIAPAKIMTKNNDKKITKRVCML